MVAGENIVRTKNKEVMKSLLFESWHQWQVCFVSGCKKAGWGLLRIVTCIIFGLVSVIRWLWRRLIKGVGSYPALAVIVACGAFLAVWLLTYANGKAKLVTAEHTRDSLVYELKQITTLLDKGEKVVVGSDTIRVFDSYEGW